MMMVAISVADEKYLSGTSQSQGGLNNWYMLIKDAIINMVYSYV